MKEGGSVSVIYCVRSADHWVNGGYVDVLFTCGEFSFCFLESCSYSKEWVKLGTKGVWHCSSKVKCHQGDTPRI